MLTGFTSLLILLCSQQCAASLRKPRLNGGLPMNRNDQNTTRNLQALYSTVDSKLYPIPLVGAAALWIDDGSLFGKVTLWSAGRKYQFAELRSQTWTADFDPMDGSVTELLIVDTNHDMFCPGTAMLHDGSHLITGGNNNKEATLYDPNEPMGSRWSSVSPMIIGRGYHSMTTLTDGTVFTVGGSWSGGRFEKVAEVYDPINNVWTPRPGIFANGTMNTEDAAGIYRADNHMWFVQANNGLVFHAGPSKRMHWLDVNGGINGVGQKIESLDRNTQDQMNGNGVYIDALAGKFLALGGAVNYARAVPTDTAQLITLPESGLDVVIREVGPMVHPRALCNSVVLPSGEVVITGGQDAWVELFTDDFGVLPSEIYNPVTETFTALPPHADLLVARNYHGVSLLMKDGRVLVSGGGLCERDCPEANHFDVQIITPPYLLEDDGTLKPRPHIVSVDADTFHLGGTIEVTMDTSASHTFSLVRYGTATHSVNNDQRLIPLHGVTNDGNGKFTIDIPDKPHALIPGKYFLFAMNSDGVPSIAHIMTRFFDVPTPGPFQAPPVQAEHVPCEKESDCVYMGCVRQMESFETPLMCCIDWGYSTLLGPEQVPETRVCFAQQPDGTRCTNNNFCQSDTCGHMLEDPDSPEICCPNTNSIDGMKVCRFNTPGGGYCTNDRVCASNECVNNQCTYSSKEVLTLAAPTTSPPPPTSMPTKSPTTMPSIPTESPTISPTVEMVAGFSTESPTAPSTAPTRSPTESPTIMPTSSPTLSPTESPTKSPTKMPTSSPTKSPTNQNIAQSTCTGWGTCPEGTGECVRQTEDLDAPLSCCIDRKWSVITKSLVCMYEQDDGGVCSHNQFCQGQSKCAHTAVNASSTEVCCSEITTADNVKVCRGSVPDGGYCSDNNHVCESGSCVDGSCASVNVASISVPDESTCSGWGTCPEGTGECVRQTEDADAPLSCCIDTKWSMITNSLVCMYERENGGTCSHNQFCQSETCGHKEPDNASSEICCNRIFTLNNVKTCRWIVPIGGDCVDDRMCTSGVCASGKCA